MKDVEKCNLALLPFENTIFKGFLRHASLTSLSRREILKWLAKEFQEVSQEGIKYRGRKGTQIELEF